jgi:hypothetical protein
MNDDYKRGGPARRGFYKGGPANNEEGSSPTRRRWPSHHRNPDEPGPPSV